MASIPAIAAKRQRSLDRIAAKLGITFTYIRGDPDNRHACYLEQIANTIDPDDTAVPPHVINEAVTEIPVTTVAASPKEISEPLPQMPAGFYAVAFSGGYLLNRHNTETYFGKAGEWRDRQDARDTFDTEKETIKAAIALTDEQPTRKEKRHARSTAPQT